MAPRLLLLLLLDVCTSFVSVIVVNCDSSSCRCLPWDSSCWPSPEVWGEFNRSIAGRLLSPRPYASPCHDPSYDELACEHARQQQTNAFHRAEVVGAMQYPDWESDRATGGGCIIGNSSTTSMVRSSPCVQGAVSTYAINVSEIWHIQRGVLFAGKHKLRIVVKSTGHDWKGRSTAPGSLMLWLYNLKLVTIHDSFVPHGSAGEDPGIPAASAESGVQWRQMYAAVGAAGRVIVGGMGSSVSTSGGYVQGGGHSPLSRTFGLAADNVLEFTVVTADGEIRIANKCQNRDLFFALSGGGPSTYGVVVSATFKTFPPLTSVIQILYIVGSLDPVSHQNLITRLIQENPQMDEARLAGYFYIYTDYLLLSFLLPNGSVAAARDALSPLVSYVNHQPGLVTINYTVVPHPNFVDWHEAVLCQANPGVCTDATGSVRRLATRFMPKALIQQSPGLIAQTFAQILARGISPIVGLLVVGGEVSIAAGNNNSVAGFWRRALWHVSLGVTWTETASLAMQIERQKFLTDTANLLRNITPGSGCYMNEADYNEPEWQASFFGENYSILKSIKKSVDPHSLFICHHCVGSEEWTPDLNCLRLKKPRVKKELTSN